MFIIPYANNKATNTETNATDSHANKPKKYIKTPPVQYSVFAVYTFFRVLSSFIVGFGCTALCGVASPAPNYTLRCVLRSEPLAYPRDKQPPLSVTHRSSKPDKLIGDGPLKGKGIQILLTGF